MARTEQQFEAARDAIIVAVLEAYTQNGLGMDTDDMEQATKAVQDAVTNAYEDDMTDAQWHDATWARMVRNAR